MEDARMTHRILKSAALIAAFGLWAGSASAAVTTCPNPDGADQTYRLTTASSAIECWDWGTGNINNGTVLPEGESATPYDGNNILELPFGFTEVPNVVFDSDTCLFCTQLGLTVTGDQGDESSSGNFYFMPPVLTKDVIISFKAATGLDATWAAFRLFAGFVSDPDDMWEIFGPNSRELSNVRVWVEGGGDEFLVPIPAAAWLLGSGLLGLFAVGRRRKAGQVAAA
jgi:hypothetical protein